jgi:hypothetical protein
MKGRTSGGSAEPSEQVSEDSVLDEGGLFISDNVQVLL